MERDRVVSDFVFSGRLKTIAVGNALPVEADIVVIQEQEGNIPSIYELYIEEVYFEINCLNNIVVGIQLPLDYNPDITYSLVYNNKYIKIGFNTHLSGIETFFKDADITTQSSNDEETILIEVLNKVIFLFSQNSLFKIYKFDKNLYNLLSLS